MQSHLSSNPMHPTELSSWIFGREGAGTGVAVSKSGVLIGVGVELGIAVKVVEIIGWG